MKKLIILFFVVIILLLSSCNNDLTTSNKLTDATDKATLYDDAITDIDGDDEGDYPELLLSNLCCGYKLYNYNNVITTIKINEITGNDLICRKSNYLKCDNITITISDAPTGKVSKGDFITVKGFVYASASGKDLDIRIVPMKFLKVKKHLYDFNNDYGNDFGVKFDN